MFFTAHVLSSLRLFKRQKAKQYKQKTWLQSEKTQIEILAYPGLA